MSLIFASIPAKKLAQGITSASSTFYVNNILGFDGLTDVAPADLGTQHYICFRNDTGTRVEFMEVDPATISSGPITIVRRGLSYYGDRTTENTDLKLDWSAAGTSVMFGTDVPQIFQYLKEYIDAAAIAGAVPASTTAGGLVIEASQAEIAAGTTTKVGTNGTFKLFPALDKLVAWIATFTASETVKGMVEEATDAEVAAGTATGGTGAKLVITPEKLATRLAAYTYITFKNGTTTKDTGSATATTIAHGLSATPKRIRIHAIMSTAVNVRSVGSYDSGGQNCISTSTTTACVLNNSTIINIEQGGANNISGICSVDGTNITLTWARNNAPSGTLNILWEAEA
ncbi:MAG TPA: hypothetical protein DD730_14905 [Desulfosporosinus sp.]|nr:hypothetical protein [Desulfosporosinus sp.]